MPDVVSMENVPELRRYEGAPVFHDFVSKLNRCGYHVSWYEVYCPDYGVPQSRKRLVLFASKFGHIAIVPRTHVPTRYRTVRDTIAGLEPLEDGQVSETDRLHQACNLSAINKKRIMATPPAGGWKHWKRDLILECHRRKAGKSYGSVYGRMDWDKPAPTMTTQCIGLGNGRFGHPDQHRAISLREAALFQTFPKSYDFFDPNRSLSKKTIARHIGNAVPVRLGRIIARSIKRHLEEIACHRSRNTN